MDKDKIFKALKILFLVVIIVVAIKLIPYMKAETIQDWVNSYGQWGPIIYILLWTFLPIPMLPITPLTVASGILFGFWHGLLYMMIGIFLNSSLMFVISRKFFKDQVRDFLMPRLPEAVTSRLYLKNQKSLFLFYFTLRCIPLISYGLINYSAGLTEIKYRHYIAATILGILPRNMIYINLVDKAFTPKSPEFILAIALTVLMAVGSILLAIKFMPRADEDEPGERSFKESAKEIKDMFVEKINEARNK